MLVKTEEMAVAGRSIQVRFFESRLPNGHRRYSAELVLGPGDSVILDDDSMPSLEVRARRLVPATVYSRTLAGHPAA